MYKLTFGDREPIILTASAYAIGSAETCDIQLHSPTIAPLHAHLVLRDGQWRIMDLSSESGSFVNERQLGIKSDEEGRLLPELIVLKDKDTLRFNGSETAVFEQCTDEENAAHGALTAHDKERLSSLERNVAGLVAANTATFSALCELRDLSALITTRFDELELRLAASRAAITKSVIVLLAGLGFIASAYIGVVAVRNYAEKGGVYKALVATVLESQGATSFVGLITAAALVAALRGEQ